MGKYYLFLSSVIYHMEAKKMILSRIMKNVRVRRDYEIEIDLTLGCEQLGME